MKKSTIFVLALFFLLAISLSACTARNEFPGEGISVRMGQAPWQTGWFQAQVYKALLGELGYLVDDPVTLDNQDFYVFAARGEYDFWVNGWFPNQDKYLQMDETIGKIEKIGYQVKGGALQGYMIDQATALEMDITNLADLQDPEIASLFDADGDGKADLIGCDFGWQCQQIIEHHLNTYQLAGTVTQVSGDYAALIKNVVARYEQGEPVLFYAWTPNWVISKLVPGKDAVWLSVPFSSSPNDPDIDSQADSIPNCQETPCDLGYIPSDIRVAANAEFLKSNPAAARLFEVVEIPLADIAAQNLLQHNGEDSKADLHRHAQEWIADNRAQVDLWLEAAREAGK